MSDDARIRELLADHVLGLLGPDEAARVERALADDDRLRAEAAALRAALFALPEALEPEPPAPGAWEALRRRLGEADADGAAAPATPPRRIPAAPGAAATERRRGVPERRRPTPARRGYPPRAIPALTLALTVCVVLLAGTAGWGLVQRSQATLSGHEEAVIAYWMRNPALAITPLEPVAGAHAGVVCVLPDGRAMVLQPHAPDAGRDYVLYGQTAAGRIELGRTRGRLIEFQADGVQAVELTTEGLTSGTVARATLP